MYIAARAANAEAEMEQLLGRVDEAVYEGSSANKLSTFLSAPIDGQALCGLISGMEPGS